MIFFFPVQHKSSNNFPHLLTFLDAWQKLFHTKTNLLIYILFIPFPVIFILFSSHMDNLHSICDSSIWFLLCMFNFVFCNKTKKKLIMNNIETREMKTQILKPTNDQIEKNIRWIISNVITKFSCRGLIKKNVQTIF